MAIQKHIVELAQKSKVDDPDMNDTLSLVKTANDKMNAGEMKEELLHTVCILVLNKISNVQMPRESSTIQAMMLDSIPIIEFFRNSSRFDNLVGPVLTHIHKLITDEKAVSPLTYLGLAIITQESIIDKAVILMLNATHYAQDPKIKILTAMNRLCTWQRTSNFDVPLHLWIVKVLTALYNENHHDILEEIVSSQILPMFLTMLMPAFQPRTFFVVQAMFQLQRNVDIYRKIEPRIVKVLMNLEETNSGIFEQLLDVISDYVNDFLNMGIVSKAVTDYLEAHNRPVTQKPSRYRSISYLSNNVRVGLENLGNTCYINSVMQALFMTKSFCSDLLKLSRNDMVVMTVQKIFALLMYSERQEINIRFALQQIQPIYFQSGLQHDSSELMSSLLDKLHEADKSFYKPVRDRDDLPHENAPPPKNPKPELTQPTIIQRHFGGTACITYICSTCKQKSVSIDTFSDLALSFPEKEKNAMSDKWNIGDAEEFSVQQLLDYYFFEEKLTLDSDNQYFCEKCKILCDGFRCTELIRPPKNLILTLKHFRYDSRYHTRSKLLIKKMIHDEEITLKVRSGEDENSSQHTVHYQLEAAVVHSGLTVDSGHYYTFAREKDSVWYKFNDSFVSPTTIQELHSLHNPNTPYILFYRISNSSAPSSPNAACSTNDIIMDCEDKTPNLEELPAYLRKIVRDDITEYRKEMEKRNLPVTKPLAKSNRYNDDDPPSSCGGNFGFTQGNRFIY